MPIKEAIDSRSERTDSTLAARYWCSRRIEACKKTRSRRRVAERFSVGLFRPLTASRCPMRRLRPPILWPLVRSRPLEKPREELGFSGCLARLCSCRCCLSCLSWMCLVLCATIRLTFSWLSFFRPAIDRLSCPIDLLSSLKRSIIFRKTFNYP